MVKQIFANFTWLDICVALIIVRGCWIGFQKGFLVEVFKMFALIVATFIALHFYSQSGDVFIHVLRRLDPVAHVFSYVVLIGITVGIFRIVRDGIVVLLKDKESEEIFAFRITGLVLGFVRSLVLSSLLVVGCLIADVGSLKRIVRHSFTAPSILAIGPQIYVEGFRRLVRPVFPNEEENEKVSAFARSNKRVFD